MKKLTLLLFLFAFSLKAQINSPTISGAIGGSGTTNLPAGITITNIQISGPSSSIPGNSITGSIPASTVTNAYAQNIQSDTNFVFYGATNVTNPLVSSNNGSIYQWSTNINIWITNHPSVTASAFSIYSNNFFTLHTGVVAGETWIMGANPTNQIQLAVNNTNMLQYHFDWLIGGITNQVNYSNINSISSNGTLGTVLFQSIGAAGCSLAITPSGSLSNYWTAITRAIGTQVMP